MSDSSTKQNLEDFDEIIMPNNEDNSQKIELDKKEFKGPTIEIYNYLMEDIKTDDKNGEISKKEYDEFEKEINKKEQIDEIKVFLFFVLHNNCDYYEKYDSLINSARDIIAKRLVIQNYKIEEKKIKFEKKRYIFISPKTNQPFFSFKDGNKEIQIQKNLKEFSMTISGKSLLKVNDFIKQNEKNIENIEELKYKKAKKNKSNDISKDEMNEIKVNFSNTSSSEKLMSLTDEELPDIIQNQSKQSSISSNTNQEDDSEKELNGDMFYDIDSRYIFNSYKKEVDGIFSKHRTITLNKEEIYLKDGLEDLLANVYDIENDIKSHIIFKNFKEEQINENESFILEVKKSMAELLSLLNQIKNISKVINYTQGVEDDKRLPRCIIGIICKFENSQIYRQQQYLYSNNENLLKHIMEIIKNNNVKVVIGVIKNEQILGYPLGKPDYDKDIGKETRVDINFMNTFIGNLDEKKVDELKGKYSQKYQSLTLTKNPQINYDTLNNNYQALQKKLEQKEKENSELQQKLEQALNYIKIRIGVEVNQNEIFENNSIKK